MSTGLPNPPGSPITDEILDALQMPPHGLRLWLTHMRAFCEQHGGERRYGELLELLSQCSTALDRKETPDR